MSTSQLKNISKYSSDQVYRKSGMAGKVDIMWQANLIQLLPLAIRANSHAAAQVIANFQIPITTFVHL